MTALAYRRDIDGLRALAIVPVVLFHFGVPGFSGGFVGVDVFFVISGFLITSIIWRERQAGTFSFIDFWTRRARRILPSLFVMLAVVLIAGWYLLTPDDYQELGRSLRYQAFFGSNFFFMRGHGYFAPAEAVQPLLHTWSLAVEEQFYLLFPLLLALLSSRLRRWRLALALLALASLVLCQWELQRHAQAAFYMLPMRAWELLLGALLAVAPGAARRFPHALYETVAALGLGAIGWAVVAYDAKTPFPGAAALVPTLGAAASIWANGGRSTVAGRLLSTPVLVGIGLMSYAWYLWHWPVVVFANYASFDSLSLIQRGGLLLLSLALGYASWRWVEGPLRRRQWLAGRRPLLLAALLGMVMFTLAGQALRGAQGVPSRLSAQALRYAAAGEWQAGQLDCLYDRHALDAQTLCRFGPNQPTRVLVWGDSHAAALAPALREQARGAGVAMALAGHSACPPITGRQRERVCEDFNTEAWRLATQASISEVVLVAHWSLYTLGEENGDTGLMLHAPGSHRADTVYAERRLAEGLRDSVARLRAAGKRVWLTKETPEQAVDIAARLTRLSMQGLSGAGFGRPLRALAARQAFTDRLFAELSTGDEQVRVLDPTPLFCADGMTCVAEERGEALYRDTNHLSDQGALKAAPLFDPLIRTLTR